MWGEAGLRSRSIGPAVLWRDPLPLAVAIVGVPLGLVAAQAPLAAVALIVAAFGFTLVLTRPELVLLAMIAALPWENMLHYPSAQLSTVKGIGAAVMVAYLLRLCSDRRVVVQLPRLLAIVSALGVWIAVSLVFSADPGAGVQKLLRWTLFMAFFFLVVQLVDGRRGVQRVLRCFTASVAAAAAYTLWLFIGARHGYRASGPLEDPNDLAYLMACTIPIAVYLIKSDPRRRLPWAACFVVITAAMLATFSRGALVGIGALLVWGILTRRVPLRVVLAGMLTAVVLVAIAFTAYKSFLDDALAQKEHIAQSNVESREARWSAALRLGRENPLTGVGVGMYPREALPILRDDDGSLPAITVPQTVVHNSYLEVLAENGVPALALFIAYLIVAWGLLRSVRRRAVLAGDQSGQALATALQASLVIAIVSGISLSEELTAPFWLLGGLAVVLARRPAPETAAPDPRPAALPAPVPALTESPA